MNRHPANSLRSVLPEPVKRPLRRGFRAVQARIGLAPLPGLLLWYRGDTPPVVPPLAPALTWRAYQPSDLPAWVDLLNLNAELGRWDESRLRHEAATLAPATQRFVFDGDRMIAGAGAYDRTVEGIAAWEVGWVARHPDYRGYGLGEQIVAAATTAALELPKRPVFLFTDDHRLPGIRVYLRLGFEPDLGAHPSYPERWRKIHAALAEQSKPASASAA